MSEAIQKLQEKIEADKETLGLLPRNNLKNVTKTLEKITEVKERDELDFEIKIIKRRHKFYCYKCLDCGKEVKTTIPVELSAENQYGANVKALGITLINHGFVSYNRTRKIIFGLTNGEVDPCEGYLTKLQKKTSSMLKNFVFDTKEEILKSKLNYWDDTVVAIADKDKACMRTYTNSRHVLYKAHVSKDTKGMDEDGILQNLPSDCTVMHDHLKHNYFSIHFKPFINFFVIWYV